MSICAGNDSLRERAARLEAELAAERAKRVEAEQVSASAGNYSLRERVVRLSAELASEREKCAALKKDNEFLSTEAHKIAHELANSLRYETEAMEDYRQIKEVLAATLENYKAEMARTDALVTAIHEWCDPVVPPPDIRSAIDTIEKARGK